MDLQSRPFSLCHFEFRVRFKADGTAIPPPQSEVILPHLGEDPVQSVAVDEVLGGHILSLVDRVKLGMAVRSNAS